MAGEGGTQRIVHYGHTVDNDSLCTVTITYNGFVKCYHVDVYFLQNAKETGTGRTIGNVTEEAMKDALQKILKR